MRSAIKKNEPTAGIHARSPRHPIMNPRPVPSECTDMTPPVMWGTLWELNPDGTMQLDLRDSSGFTFWRGTFRPAEEASHADA